MLNDKFPHYQGPTHFYTPEEKSYTVLQAYRERVLTSEEIKSFLFKDRLNVWTYWGFPVAAYFGLTSSGVLRKSLNYSSSYKFTKLAPILVSGLLWLGWVNFSPFQSAVDKEKQNLLNLVERKIGVSMKRFNDVLPRYWTTQEIHRRTRQLYNQRHSIFVNILYPAEEAMGPLFDPSTYTWRYKGEKLTK